MEARLYDKHVQMELGLLHATYHAEGDSFALSQVMYGLKWVQAVEFLSKGQQESLKSQGGKGGRGQPTYGMSPGVKDSQSSGGP